MYITPDQLRRESFALGMQVVRSGFRPDFLVALWRGGAPIGCFVHELLKWKGINADHIAIRTSRYTGIDKAGEGSEVAVHSTRYVRERLKPGSSILLVDDVWDSGHTIVAFIRKLEKRLSFPISQLDLRVATIYYKPARNQTPLKPAFYLHETTEWLVFPHELEGMTLEEAEKAMGKEVADIIK